MTACFDYQYGWEHAASSRSEEGVLKARRHSDDGPLWWDAGRRVHEDLELGMALEGLAATDARG